jgi:1,4-alpha-glucan branching enzyme
VADLNKLYRNEAALHSVDFDHTGFEWVDCHNYGDSVLSFIRKAKDPKDYLLICMNFTPVPRPGYYMGVPEGCWYQEVFNSDSMYYAGSNVGTAAGGVQAEQREHHGRPYAIPVTLPPLGIVVFKPQR